jgi:hypothetical protein
MFINCERQPCSEFDGYFHGGHALLRNRENIALGSYKLIRMEVR